jgi:hypothetical protein
MFSPVVAATGIITKNLFGISAGLPVVATSRSVQGLKWSTQEELFRKAFAIAVETFVPCACVCVHMCTCMCVCVWSFLNCE